MNKSNKGKSPVIKETNISSKTLLIIFLVSTGVAATFSSSTTKIIFPGHIFISVLVGLGITFSVFLVSLVFNNDNYS